MPEICSCHFFHQCGRTMKQFSYGWCICFSTISRGIWISSQKLSEQKRKEWDKERRKRAKNENWQETVKCIYLFGWENYTEHVEVQRQKYMNTYKYALFNEFCNFLFHLGQHCLDPDAYILDVYHMNPQAEWVIKPQSPF